MTWGQVADLGLQYRARWMQCEMQKAGIRGAQD